MSKTTYMKIQRSDQNDWGMMGRREVGGTSGTCDNGVPTWHDKLVDMCMEGHCTSVLTKT